MEKKDMVKDYSVYELSPEEVKEAIKEYLYENHNTLMDNNSILEVKEDGSATIEIVWANQEKVSL